MLPIRRPPREIIPGYVGGDLLGQAVVPGVDKNIPRLVFAGLLLGERDVLSVRGRDGLDAVHLVVGNDLGELGPVGVAGPYHVETRIFVLGVKHDRVGIQP
jgi:hypothetical protein